MSMSTFGILSISFIGSITFIGCGSEVPIPNAPSTPAPSPGPTPSPPPTPTKGKCLCLFDIDRTLTAEQGMSSQCPGTKLYDGVEDQAYAGGTLVLSELGENLNKTFCSQQCYMGIITAGIASGDNSKERALLLSKFGENRTLSNVWSYNANISSSLVLAAQDHYKQDAARSIIHWFNSTHSLAFSDEDVYFFDDRPDNVQPFQKAGFNAIQVSCNSRDSTMGNITGDCGGRLSEVVQKKGLHLCGSNNKTIPPPVQLIAGLMHI